MPKEPALPGLRYAMKKKVTRCDQFLAEMDAVVCLVAVVGADRAALPEGRAEGRAAADAAGDMSRARNRSGGAISRRLAAGLLPPELVCLERSDGRGDPA
jgi:hypothetical protein